MTTKLPRFTSLFVPLTDAELDLFADDEISSFADLIIPTDCGTVTDSCDSMSGDTVVMRPEDQLPPMDSGEWELLFEGAR